MFPVSVIILSFLSPCIDLHVSACILLSPSFFFFFFLNNLASRRQIEQITAPCSFNQVSY